MLKQAIVDALSSYANSDKPIPYSREISYSTVRNQIEPGQKLYRFNRDRTGLDVFVFVSWFDLVDGGVSGVINVGESLHHNNLHVDNYITRDILLSARRDYVTECYYLDEELAKRRLKRYMKEKLEDQLAKLEEKAG